MEIRWPLEKHIGYFSDEHFSHHMDASINTNELPTTTKAHIQGYLIDSSVDINQIKQPSLAWVIG